MRTLTFNRVIGSGSFGTVYQAELRVPRGFSRQCAVKVMNATSPDQDHFRARMRDEARLLGMLQDEQILGVAELVMVEGRDVVVMDYVEGVDLSDIIAHQQVPPRALAELGAEIAGTLHRAHTARHPHTHALLQVVHRDVKPANIMVTSRGGVRLLDFGVARAAFSARETETQGLVLGTLNYFPPEILAGADPSPAVDIFGLGLILWECATGRDWGSPQVHRKRFDRRVQQRMSELDEAYVSILPVLERILHWDPAQRPHGGEVEELLLLAADAAVGEGLRTWSRQVVPPMLEARLANPTTDDLIGQTRPLQHDEGPPQDTELPPAESPTEPPLPHGESPLSTHSSTYNDLAPPSAVDRTQPLRPPVVEELELPRAFDQGTPPPAVPAIVGPPRLPEPEPVPVAPASSTALYVAAGAALVALVVIISLIMLSLAAILLFLSR